MVNFVSGIQLKYGGQPSRAWTRRPIREGKELPKQMLKELFTCTLRSTLKNKGFLFGAPNPCELEGSTPSKEGPRILRVGPVTIN